MYFKLYKDSQGDWRWTLYADSAEGRNNKSDCVDGIDLVRSVSATTPIKGNASRKGQPRPFLRAYAQRTQCFKELQATNPHSNGNINPIAAVAFEL